MTTRDRAALSLEPAALTKRQAAVYCGVSLSYFEEDIRPLVPFVDLKRPDAKQPMPRWLVADLDRFLASRRKEQKAS